MLIIKRRTGPNERFRLRLHTSGAYDRGEAVISVPRVVCQNVQMCSHVYG